MTASSTYESPASRQAAIGQDMLEGALMRVKNLPPRVDRLPITNAFERVLAALTKLGQSGVDDPRHMHLLSEAQTELQHARGVVRESDQGRTATQIARTLDDLRQTLEGTRADTINRVVAAQHAAALDEAAERSGLAQPFAASLGGPRLHAPVRGPLAPTVDLYKHEDLGREDALGEAPMEELQADDEGLDGVVDEDAAADAALEEELAALERELRPRSIDLNVIGRGASAITLEEAVQRPGLPGEVAQLKRLTRDCLEELGQLGNLRTVRDRDRWAGVALFEERLLKDLDAVLALGGAFCRSDARPNDPLKHGSLNVLEEVLTYTHDSVTVDPARAFARAFVLGCVEGDDTIRAAVVSLKQSPPLTHAAQAAALGLSSSPSVPPAMRRLCLEGRRDMIIVALDVLMARGAADLPTVVTLLEHPDPPVRERAARCLAFVDQRAAVTELLSSMIEGEVEDSVTAAMIEALMILNPRAALLHVRDRLQEELEEPGMLKSSVRSELMRLLGIGGEERDVELLHRLFVHEDPVEAEALGWHGHPGHIVPLLDGLKRGGLHYRRAVMRALYRITGGDVRIQQDVGPDVYDQPTMHIDWLRFWEANKQHFQKTQRYRFGAPYGVGHTVAELRVDGAPMGTRRMCALELAIVCAEPLRLRVDGWVSQQHEALSRLEQAIAATPRSSGGKWLPDCEPLSIGS